MEKNELKVNVDISEASKNLLDLEKTIERVVEKANVLAVFQAENHNALAEDSKDVIELRPRDVLLEIQNVQKQIEQAAKDQNMAAMAFAAGKLSYGINLLAKENTVVEGYRVRFVDANGVEHLGTVSRVWRQDLVNIDLDDKTSSPTSVPRFQWGMTGYYFRPYNKPFFE